MHPAAVALMGERTLEDIRILMEAEAIASRTRNRNARSQSRGDRTPEPVSVTVLPDEEASAFRERAIASAQRLAGGSR